MANTPGFNLRREQRMKQVEAELQRLDRDIISPIVKLDKRFQKTMQQAHSNLEQLERYVVPVCGVSISDVSQTNNRRTTNGVDLDVKDDNLVGFARDCDLLRRGAASLIERQVCAVLHLPC